MTDTGSSATAHAASGPLAGLRVIDCSTVLAGPYCTMLLGDLGADVIKVEPPEGDATRGWGPPWVGERRRRDADRGLLPRGQPQQARLRLDLKTGDGREILRRLLADADVLVENFRVGGFARLGFDDDGARRRSTRASSTSRSPATGPTARTPTGPATTS